MPKAVRLTGPQVNLLIDIATHPQMYVRDFSRDYKTARVLARHGLATMSYGGGWQEVVITPAGCAEAARRAITVTAQAAAAAARNTARNNPPNPDHHEQKEGTSCPTAV